MNQVLNGKEIAARVLGSTGGAAAKGAFKVDAVNFMWVDMYLRDKAIRNKINTFREGIQRATQYPISRDELRIMFERVSKGRRNIRSAATNCELCSIQLLQELHKSVWNGSLRTLRRLKIEPDR